ncbi:MULTISPECIES: DUF3106 domain-containing protein [unclassified Duganella]|uniref:DUF3106 domain-containing protein n=1 Tax=unclassified Duganella TaxID=2636909 RepID=UPI000880D2A5|nr:MULTISPECIES: DUF3106 domain-containing protein [unclassified Duganella]SDF47175.1 Protein of unknown function [Duganella sp. OV458]SDI79650.1 Protein of unknown function [Duganella sp. OV510]
MAWSSRAKWGAAATVLAVAAGGAWIAAQPDAVDLVAAPVAAVTGQKGAVAPEKILWKDLTPAQQQALEPLAGEWDGIEPIRKQKWLGIAKRYARMNPDEQVRVQRRMREWVGMSPDERRQIRQNYARAQKLNPAQKAVSWEEYQMLTDEQKKELAAKADTKKQVVNLPTPSQAKMPTPAPVKPAASIAAPVVPPITPPVDPNAPLPNASNVTPIPPTSTPSTQATPPADVK